MLGKQKTKVNRNKSRYNLYKNNLQCVKAHHQSTLGDKFA